MLFLNGELFKLEPWVEIEKLQTFLNLKQLIRKDHFVFNKAKGFYCYKSECMTKRQGRKHPAIDTVTLNALRML